MHLQWAMKAGSHCVQIDIPLLGPHYLERQVVAALGPGPATSSQMNIVTVGPVSQCFVLERGTVCLATRHQLAN